MGGDPMLKKPTTGIADCCARAASGHAAAAPHSSVMNSRRLMPDIGLPPRFGAAGLPRAQAAAGRPESLWARPEML